MSDLRNEVVDILAKMKFLQGQRAGRELWNDKPFEVQEKDLESFNKGIETIRKYILQLEEKAVPVRGEWKRIGSGSLYDRYECTNCHRPPKWECLGDNNWRISFTDICPHCGADMRGEKND